MHIGAVRRFLEGVAHRARGCAPRRASIGAIVFAAVLLLTARPAFADLTAFVGVNTTPANRLTTGIAVGASLLVIGFEGEYAKTVEDVAAAAPSLSTGMGSIFVQNPIPIAGIQVYAIAGTGIYKESLAEADNWGVVASFGGGAKIELISHIRLRIDYRAMKLPGARYDPAHRVYAGLNIAF